MIQLLTGSVKYLQTSSSSLRLLAGHPKRFLKTLPYSAEIKRFYSLKVQEEEESEYGLYRLLTARERELLLEQRKITELTLSLASQIRPADKKNALAHSSTFFEELNLEATFSVVVAGEFNAGKSTLINALLGSKLLESGALPTTDATTIVANTSNNEQSATNEQSMPLGVVLHSFKDAPLLQDLTLVDTPGTNSAWMDHTERTLRLLPAADLILFVTSADRPFSESERDLLRRIQSYRKSIVLIINKMDILDSAGGDHGKEQKDSIVEFVTDHASELLGARPIVIPVSSRDALSAKLMEKKSNSEEQQRSNVWYRSNFGTLESFLRDTLTTDAKVKSKLTNPIGVVEGVIDQCMETLKEQRSDLQTDIATLNILKSQFTGWKKEISSDLDSTRQHMVELVRKEGERCEIMLGRMRFISFYTNTLLDTSRLENEWEDTKRQASAHRNETLEKDLLEQVRETSDTVATRGRAQGQAVIEYLGKRPGMKDQSLVGSITAVSSFEGTKKLLEDRLLSVVDDILKSYDENIEKNRLFFSLRKLAAFTAAIQTGACGCGIAAFTNMLDPVSGGMGALSMMVSGSAAYLVGTSTLGKNYQMKWTQRAQILDSTLDAICSKELDRLNRRILDGVAPYTRFVESEQLRIDTLEEECEGVVTAARSLRNKINAKVD